MKLLHFIRDDKFFRFATGLFAALPGVHNRFVAYLPRPHAPLRFIADLDLWRRAGPAYLFSRSLHEDLAWCDGLIVHYMDSAGAVAMLRAPRDVAKVWSAWGADYQPLLAPSAEPLLEDETAGIVAELRRRRVRSGLRQASRQLGGRVLDRVLDRPLLRAAARRADFFSAPLQEDFELLRAALGGKFHAQFVALSYGSVEQTFRPGPEGVSGQDILVGNSATPTNNHAEALRLLAGRELGARKVVVPLSYGDAAYREAIVGFGRRLLGSAFEPLVEFLPLPDYNARIARCSAALMNHRRQQALGNIAAMLWRGARVYLDERGVLYRFFSQRGAYVFGMRALAVAQAAEFEPLGAAERLRNREVLETLWSDDAVARNARQFVDSVRAHRPSG